MIILKTNSQIDGIRRSCQIVAYVLKELKKEIKPGITTKYLDNMAEDLCYQRGAIPGFKGYRGFPYSICSSRNSEIVHGFPSNNPLRDGEILSIDFGALYKGWYGDSAFTAPVGNVTEDIHDLLKIGRECLYKGIEVVRPNCKVGDISYAVQRHAESHGFNVVREFVGHGIGKDLHEEPQVPNWGSKDSGCVLKPGSVIAIEPMVLSGNCEIKIMPDHWTAVTADGAPAVHFEHTIAITGDGTEILTRRD